MAVQKARPSELLIFLCDCAEGIAEDQLPPVFDRDWPLKESNPNGTGLGLYISRGIVEATATRSRH